MKILCSILLAVLLLTAYFLSSVVPLEEPFLTFATAEEAFHYKYDYEILLTIEGNESTQIICNYGQNEGLYGAILSKTTEGWKPEIQLDKKNIAIIFAPNCVIHLQRYKKTEDFYLTITSADGMNELYDNRNTEFQNVTGTLYSGKKVPPGSHYAFVDGIDEDYILTIDGEEFTFPNVK